MKKIHSFYYVFISLFIFIVFILSLFFLSLNRVSMISEDYYKKEILYQEEINAMNRAKHKNMINMYVLKSGIHLKFDPNIKSAKLKMIRNENYKDDIHLKINPDNHGIYVIPNNILKLGLYDIEIEWYYNSKKYIVKKTLKWNL